MISPTPAAGGSLPDRLARLAAHCFGVPAVSIGLLRSGRLAVAGVFGPPDLEQRTVAFAEKVCRGGSPVAEDAAAGGGYRFSAGVPIRAAGNLPVGAFCLFDDVPRDLSPREAAALDAFAGFVAAEIALDSEPPEPAAQVRGSEGGFSLSYGLDGRILRLDTAAERLTGYGSEEAGQLHMADLVAPAERPAIDDTILAALGGAAPQTRTLRLMTREGREVAVETESRLLFRDGHPDAVHVAGHEVTSQRRAQDELCRINAHFRELHRLSTGNYDSVESLIRDYLKTGCVMFGAVAGAFKPLGEEPGIHHGPKCADCRDAQGRCEVIRTPICIDGDEYAVLCFCRSSPDAATAGPHETGLLEMMARSVGKSVLEARMREQLARQASLDPLTGLYNRSYQHGRLERAIAQAEADGAIVAVGMLDLDRFKQVNDVFGHLVGDTVLRQVAQRMLELVSPADSLARMGGDEFTVVFTGITSREEAIAAAQKIQTGLRQPFELDGYEFVITASLGLSLFPSDARDAATLLKHADAALYRAKTAGSNEVECFISELGLSGFDRLEMETLLRRALENNEFELLFQPQVDLKGGLDGLEALLAWNSPKLGRILPGRFIPVAEECGLIVPIGQWVLREACLRGARWIGEGCKSVRIAVNVSALQFARTDFVETVAEALHSSGLPPRCLELEITESLIMRDIEESARRMARLRSLGVSIAMDDFGTGYSSLSYLRQLPVDVLKIDQSFVREADSVSGTLSLIQTIIVLAHNLGLAVLAEGVETERQAKLLFKSGCDRAQGHYFGEPLSAERAGKLVCREQSRP